MSTEKKKICHNRTMTDDKQLGRRRVAFFISLSYLKVDCQKTLSLNYLHTQTFPGCFAELQIQFRAHLRQLGPVERFVAVEELSSQVAVLPDELLQRRNVTFMHKDQLFVGERLSA